MITTDSGQTWQLEKCPQFEGSSTPLPSTETSCLASRAHGVIDKMHQKEIPGRGPVLGLRSCMRGQRGPSPFCASNAPHLQSKEVGQGQTLQNGACGLKPAERGTLSCKLFYLFNEHGPGLMISVLSVSWLLSGLILPATREVDILSMPALQMGTL